MGCVDQNCKEKRPWDKPGSIVVTIDGDFACNQRCEAAYKQQRDHFFNNIVHSEEATTRWLLGEHYDELKP